MCHVTLIVYKLIYDDKNAKADTNQISLQLGTPQLVIILLSPWNIQFQLLVYLLFSQPRATRNNLMVVSSLAQQTTSQNTTTTLDVTKMKEASKSDIRKTPILDLTKRRRKDTPPPKKKLLLLI